MDDESLKWVLGIWFTSLGSLMIALHISMLKRIDKIDDRLKRNEKKDFRGYEKYK